MRNEDIVIIYGNDCSKSVNQLLKYIKIEDQIKDKNANIVIKPNLLIAQDPSLGATTHTEIVVKIIEYLQEKGFKNIKIVESSWIGASTKQALKYFGYPQISKKYQVPLIDVKDDDYETIIENGIKVEISKEIVNCDFLISVPVLKGHCQTKITCALKNMKGCISDKNKRMFHNLGLMKPIATLNKIRTADLVIVDSLNGDLDFEEGGNPIETNRIYACKDSVLCDAFGASLLGYSVDEVEYIKLARSYGVGNSDINKANIINLNNPDSIDALNKKPKGTVAYLAKYVEADKACSACYGNLIHAIKRLNDTNQLFDIKKVCIGQGFKNVENQTLIGVGSCTRKLGKSLKGCPPSANDMIKFLLDNS
jgi:uncharacterized protein (DUF362 family)